MKSTRFLLALILGLFVFQGRLHAAVNPLCKTQLEAVFGPIPSEAEIFQMARKELAQIDPKQWKLAAENLLRAYAHLGEKRYEKAADDLVLNLHIENAMPPVFIADVLKTAHAAFIESHSEKGPVENFAAKIQEEFEGLYSKRRTLYFERRSPEEDGLIANLDLREMQRLNSIFERLFHPNSRQVHKEFNLYAPRIKLSGRDIIKIMPILNAKWRRPFELGRKTKPEILFIEFEDIPGTYLSLFNDTIYMNTVFNRASSFIEMEAGVIKGRALFGLRAGGHDLKGEDLLDYWKAANISRVAREVKKAYVPAELKAEYQNRLRLEREFFNTVILPKITELHPKRAVFLAVAADVGAVGTTSHEMWHGKWFTDGDHGGKFIKDVTEYWDSLTPAEQNKFMNSITSMVPYNKNDRDLMINEFQAYMLEIDPVPLPIHQPTLMEHYRVLNEMRPAFLDFMRSRGHAVGW